MLQLKAQKWTEPRSEPNPARAESRSSNNRKRTASLRGCVYVSVRVCVCARGECVWVNFSISFAIFHFTLYCPDAGCGSGAGAALVLLWQIHEWAIFILHFLTDPHSKHTDTLHSHPIYIYTHTSPVASSPDNILRKLKYLPFLVKANAANCVPYMYTIYAYIQSINIQYIYIYKIYI